MKTEYIDDRLIRVFISSTFMDMQAERDYLVNKIFPQLKRLCAGRNVEFVELDLRWGIPEEAARNGKVTEICLREIEHTRPFFIGVLGNRYGWVPTVEELSKNPALEKDFPWLIEDVGKKGLSITEIEMQYGVLRSSEEIHACFFIRSPDAVVPDHFKEPPGSINELKLNRLKEAIRTQTKYPYEYYISAEDLGKRILKRFTLLIDRLFPPGPLTDFDLYKTEQNAYIRSRTSVYIPVEEHFRRLEDFAESPSQYLLVTGDAGCGKTALLANWAECTGKKNYVIPFFIGGSRYSTAPENILEYLIESIQCRFALSRREKEKPTHKMDSGKSVSPAKMLSEELAEALALIADRNMKLILVIDAANQLEDKAEAKKLRWLPLLPQTVKVIFSTLKEDETYDIITGWEPEIYELSLMRAEDARILITKYLKHFGKELDLKNTERIILKEPFRNPLVLKTLLDEIRIFGIYGQLNQRLEYYLSANTSKDFFDKVLENLEQRYNPENSEFVQEVLSLISVSRNGLSEKDILKITRVAPLYWSQFYNAACTHLITRVGLIDFSHTILRNSVRKRYLSSPETEYLFRDRIIRYFLELKQSRPADYSPERETEQLPWQFYKSDRSNELYNYLLNIKVFKYIYHKSRDELAGYWNYLQKKDKSYSLDAYLALQPENESDWNILAYFCYQIREYDSSLKFYRKTDSLNQGFVYTDMGRPDLAEPFLRKALREAIYLSAVQPRNVAIAKYNLGCLFSKTEQPEQAEAMFQEALEISINETRNEADIMDCRYSLGNLYNASGRPEQALEMFLQALALGEKLSRNNSGYLPKVAAIWNNMGSAYSQIGRHKLAANALLKAIEIKQRLAKGNPFEEISLSRSIYNLAQSFDENHRYEVAAKLYLRAAESGLTNAQHNLGYCYQEGKGVTKNIPEAIKWYTKAAEKGVALSQCNLGNCYDKGEGIEQDYVKAVYWYKKAAQQGLEIAQYNLGNCYDKGEGIEQDYVKAVYWYKKAAQQGHVRARYRLGHCYENGEGVGQDYAEAVKWYTKAAEQGHAAAQCNLGYCYDKGEGVRQDYAEAVKWYTKAAEQGQSLAQGKLGLCYDIGKGVKQNYAKAAHWYTKAARQGDANAQFLLGHYYENGTGVQRNDTEAVHWYTKAAQQGLPQAQYILGNCYGKGKGIEQNYVKAAEWYTKAAQQEHANAQCILGYYYEKGTGVERNYTEAARWHRKAAEQGVPIAQYILGNYYAKGKGVELDYVKAAYWYAKAAQQGDDQAQCRLGYCYTKGEGVEQNDTKAIIWYKKAAEQGNAGAQCILGHYYETGTGVQRNYTEAVHWYTKAAQQGLPQAQYKLGFYYEKGEGVEQDYIKAAHWYRKAADQGNESAKESLRRLESRKNDR